MFDRISNSFALARSSWQVLRTDKQLIVFPIISGIACLLILLSFALPIVRGRSAPVVHYVPHEFMGKDALMRERRALMS